MQFSSLNVGNELRTDVYCAELKVLTLRVVTEVPGLTLTASLQLHECRLLLLFAMCSGMTVLGWF